MRSISYDQKSSLIPVRKCTSCSKDLTKPGHVEYTLPARLKNGFVVVDHAGDANVRCARCDAYISAGADSYEWDDEQSLNDL
jgi:hypothetical protein